MEQRTLGTTGLEVSVLGFGGAPVGLPGYLTPGDRDDETVVAEAVEAVRAAARLGITYFDTAPGYGGGRSERIIGRALDGLPTGVRERVLVGTKFGFGAGKTPGQYTEELRRSLDNLRTDRVDLLQLHGGTFDRARADAIISSCVPDWLAETKAAGLCRATGITAEAPSGALERLMEARAFDCLQIAYSLIYQSACDYQREPFGIIPYAKALGMGVLTMRTATSGTIQKIMAAAFPGIDAGELARLAIRYVISTPEVDCALVGMRTVDEVRENVALAEDEGARLDLRELHKRYV